MRFQALVIITANILFGWGSLYAATYYVDSVGGRDTNSGLRTTAPWRTIAKVNRTKLVPGDSILFKAGDLWREQLTVSASGAVGHPIRFGSYGIGSQPTLSGSDRITEWKRDLAPVEIDAGSHGFTARRFDRGIVLVAKVFTNRGGALESYGLDFRPSYPWYGACALYSDSATSSHFVIRNSQSAEVALTARWTVARVADGATLAPRTPYLIACWLVHRSHFTSVEGSVPRLPLGEVPQFDGRRRIHETFTASIVRNHRFAFYVIARSGPRPNTWTARVSTRPYAVWVDDTLENGHIPSKTALRNDDDWFWDGSLHIYSSSAPKDHDIEVARRSLLTVDQSAHIVFNNIHFDKGGNAYTGANAILVRQSSDVSFIDCNVTHSVNIGINSYSVDATTGDLLVQGCRFSGTGEASRSALTISTGAPSAIQTFNTSASSTLVVEYSTFQDIDAWGAHHGHAVYDQSGNLVWRYNFHYGDRGSTQSGAGAGAAVRIGERAVKAYVYGNIFSDSGGRRYWGVLVNAGTTYLSDNLFVNNNYDIVTQGGMLHATGNIFEGSQTWWYVYDTDGAYTGDSNIFFAAQQGWIWRSGHTLNTLRAWQTTSQQDSHSHERIVSLGGLL